MVTFVRLRLDMRPLRTGLDRYHLFSLAMSLERECTKTLPPVCITPVCNDSSLTGFREMLYGRHISLDPSAVKRFQKPSPPVIITPPLLSTFSPGETVPLYLVLVGYVAPVVSDLLSLLITLLERDYFMAVERVVSSGPYYEDEVDVCSFTEGKELPISIFTLDDTLHQLDGCGRRLKLFFRTPLRLLHQGRPVHRIDGPQFLGALMRRVSSLAYYYCSHEFSCDYAYLAECAKHVTLVSEAEKSGEVGRRSAGFTGTLILSGDLLPFHHFLAAGMVCNMGKGASSGYGSYDVLPSEP